MKIGLAQISPIWLQKTATLQKVGQYIANAASKGCSIVAFGEALVPGYPFWVAYTNSSQFDDSIQKDWFAYYALQAVSIESGDLENICLIARENNIAVYLGIIERPFDRGGHSLFCSLVYIDNKGIIQSVHRKLQPTYEERLVWSAGDGNGLTTHEYGGFRLGGLNCWENWMPLSRVALYGQGENIHFGVWPGSKRNTKDIPKFIAKEGRLYSLAVSGLLIKEEIPTEIPHYSKMVDQLPGILADGGSCAVAPNGKWILSPQTEFEEIYEVEIDITQILRERHNFDPTGHYSRPDVTRLILNNQRQKIMNND